MAFGRWTRYDTVNKKWQYSLDGGTTWYDVIDNALHEQATFPNVTAPSGVASKSVLYNASNKLQIKENNGGAALVVPNGSLMWSYVDPNGTGSKGSWGGYIRSMQRMPFPCTAIEVYSQVVGGTSATLNIWKNGLYLRSADIVCTPSGYTSWGTLQNTAIAENSPVFAKIVAISGAVTSIGITLKFTRP